MNNNVNKLKNLEIINKTKPLYLCIDCELFPALCTPNRKEAEIYAKYNFCKIHTYNVGEFKNIKHL